jgi:hypothetical protein
MPSTDSIVIPPDTRSFTLVRVGDLYVDQNSQRPISKSRVSEIQKKFDWNRYEVPTVSPTPDGTWFVSEGQHRVLALQEIDPDIEIPVIVTNAMDTAGRAGLAYTISTGHKALNGYAEWNLLKNGNDPYALVIDKAARAAGLTISQKAGKKTIQASKTLFRIVKHGGATPEEGGAVIHTAVQALAEAYPNTDDDAAIERWNTILLQAVAIIARLDSAIQSHDIAKALNGFSPSRWIGYRDAPPEQRGNLSEVEYVASKIIEKMNKGRHAQNRISL